MQDKELNIEDLANSFIGFLKKNFIFILGFVLIGLIIGFLRHQRAKDVHQTNVYAKSTFVPLALVKNEIASINALLEQGDFDKLAASLSLDENVLSSISSIKYYEVSSSEHLFSFQIKSIGDTNINAQVLDALTSYFEGNAYLKNYLEIEKSRLTQNEEIYNNELLNLIKIQEALLDKDVKKNYAILTNPSDLSMSIIDLQKLIKNNALLYDEVAVYKVIDAVDITTKPSLTKSLFSHVIVLSFLGSILLLTYRLFFRKS